MKTMVSIESEDKQEFRPLLPRHETPSKYDRRSGSARTIEQCKEAIDELEIDNEQPDRLDDDFESGLENERQNPND